MPGHVSGHGALPRTERQDDSPGSGGETSPAEETHSLPRDGRWLLGLLPAPWSLQTFPCTSEPRTSLGAVGREERAEAPVPETSPVHTHSVFHQPPSPPPTTTRLLASLWERPAHGQEPNAAQPRPLLLPDSPFRGSGHLGFLSTPEGPTYPGRLLSGQSASLCRAAVLPLPTGV